MFEIWRVECIFRKKQLMILLFVWDFETPLYATEKRGTKREYKNADPSEQVCLLSNKVLVIPLDTCCCSNALRKVACPYHLWNSFLKKLNFLNSWSENIVFCKVGQNWVYSPETNQGMNLKLCQNMTGRFILKSQSTNNL